MTRQVYLTALAIVAAGGIAGSALAQTKVPAAIAAPGETTVATFQGVGAQIYECKAGTDGKLAWTFREPIAALFESGKTVGRHYAGPTWEDVDGSAIVGKGVASAPGATAGDVAWLKLDVASHRGSGLFSDVTTVQRLDTHGGNLHGSCTKAGALRSVAYSATYVFLKKSN